MMNLIRMTALVAIYVQSATTAALATQLVIIGSMGATENADVLPAVIPPAVVSPVPTHVGPLRTILVLNLDGSVSQWWFDR